MANITLLRTISTLNVNCIKDKTKQSLLSEFIRNNDIDVLFIQEVNENKIQAPYLYKTILNAGTNNRGTGFIIRNDLKTEQVLLDPNGRISSIVINKTNFINIYAHSGTNNRDEKYNLFVNELPLHLNKSSIEKTIIGGDFNCIINRRDSNARTFNFCAGLRSVLISLNLKDVWDELHPDIIHFTFARGPVTSRLDRFYTSNALLKDLYSIEVVPVAFSDHHAVICKYKINTLEKVRTHGRGIWKINDHLIHNVELQRNYSDEINKIKKFTSYEKSPQQWWNLSFKNNTKRFYKTEAIKFNRDISLQKNTFHKLMLSMMNEQNSGKDVQAEMVFVKTKLKDIERKKLDSISSKTKISSLVQEEQMNLFHLAQMQNRTESKTISKIRSLISKKWKTQNEEILDEYYTYYKSNFQKIENVTTPSCEHIDRQLIEEDIQGLIATITEEELLRTIKSSSRRKSPGPDGLSYEFYRTNYNLCKLEILTLFNNFLTGKEKPSELFSKGIIMLIPKNQPAEYVTDFRPITLLNTDYKLFAKILANRIKTILNKIIGPEQKCAKTNSSITENLRQIRNITYACASNNSLKTALTSVDLEKAFDRVEHKYLWTVMKQMQFPESFINCIKNMYAKASSTVLVNGYLTKSFNIGKSVRQGCPLSMALFVIYLEPLIRKLADTTLSGIKVNNTKITVLAYADDMCFITNTDRELQNAIIEINKYCTESGSKINLEKSKCLVFNNYNTSQQFLPTVTKIKILGLIVCSNTEEMVSANFNAIFSKICFLIHMHKTRNINIMQKIWLANTFILSKVWYIAQTLLFKPGDIAKIKRAVGNYIWTGKLYRVAQNQLALNKLNGGLNLIDIDLKTKALFIRNTLYISEKLGGGDTNDALFENRERYILPRYVKSALLYAASLKSNKPETRSSKEIYKDLMEQRNYIPPICTKFAKLNWQHIWKNMHVKWIPSAWKTDLYMLANDMIPNKLKLGRHGIEDASARCEICGEIDTNIHRISKCVIAKQNYEWIQGLLSNRLQIQFISKLPGAILQAKMQDSPKYRAAYWYNAGQIHYSLSYPNGTHNEFKQMLRLERHKIRDISHIHFENNLNLF